ncbi:hypothetical protein EDD11_007692 [Mortierella claussenii]|nr:hypothetical protein EDD11_007692 [Mortierella claussenii]
MHPTSTTSPTLTLSPSPSSQIASDPYLHDLYVLANHSNGAYRPLSRPRQRVSPTPPVSFSLLPPQKLVFASGAVGTASALGHVLARPLQAKDTIPCSPQSCTQLHKEMQHSSIQQAQSPSHTFQQQCSVHKRFRLFRQRTRKCPVHAPLSGPNYILPPTTVHPLVVHPDKILLDQPERPSSSWKPTIPISTSFSSRLSSYSTLSLSLSLSTSSINHGSDGESHNSGTFQTSKKIKRHSKKEQQQQPQLRCLCYLEASLDQHDSPQQVKAHSQPLPASSWYPQKHQKEASRLRRIWNDSTIFHWSKPPSSARRPQQQPLQEQPQYTIQQQQQQEIENGSVALQSHAESTNAQGIHLEAVAIRNSLSGTDISDEGNHSLSDVEDDEDYDSFSVDQRVSFRENYPYRSKARSSRLGDDLKAISRHQAELSRQPASGDAEYGMNGFQSQHETRPLASTFVNADEEDEEDEDEDWDIQSDSGAPSSSPMYSVDAREPSSYSTMALPLPSSSKGYLKKPSNTNLNSLRSRQRCLSLPADNMPPGFRKIPSTPSENWDEDFDIDSGGINVPSQVVESQISLQMDIYNIKDFASQIEDLKTLRASLRVASSSLKATNPKKHQDLSMLFQRDWEQAEVIIDLGEIAQTSTTSSSGSAGLALAAGPLSLLSGKGSQPSSVSKSSTQKLRRPALSTTSALILPSSAPSAMTSAAALASSASDFQARSVSQSSALTGTTLVGSQADSDSNLGSSRASSRSSSASTVQIESTIQSLSIVSPEKRRPHLGSGVAPLQQPLSMKENSNNPTAFDVCTTPVTPLPNGLRGGKSEEDARLFMESPLEYEPNTKWLHSKESSATFKTVPIASHSHSSSGGGAEGVQVDVEASFHRYQKYSHHFKRHSSSRHAEEEGDDDEDDGYESYGYGYGEGSSVGVITPIPSDRHMKVLKDILMEGLGSDVARQYMFKHGEQDHVRFSVEVIPGLLGHLKGLQQRLGDQLMELQQLTVLV